jgi:hypothetical protein
MTIDSSGTAPQEAARMSSMQRIAGVLFAPAETFQDIARKPDVLVVLLLVLAIGWVSVALTIPRMDFDSMFTQQAEQMRERNPGMKDADLERMQKMSMGFAKAMGWAGPVLLVGWLAIVAAVLLLAFRMWGGEGTFVQSFSATVYAWLPLTLFSVISTIVIVARGSFDPITAATLVKSNPAFLVDLKEHPVLFSLLSSFDAFTIWTIILLVFGFAATSKLSRAKSASIVLTLWAVMILIKVGFAALGAGMKG